MAERVQKGGAAAFLPYALPVLGGAIGVFWIRYGTETGNPVIGVAAGAILGRLLAAGILRIAQARRAPSE